jgi:hypothetical protein
MSERLDAQQVIEGLNQIQIALDQFQLKDIAYYGESRPWPNKQWSFEEAEEFIDELRDHYALNKEEA